MISNKYLVLGLEKTMSQAATRCNQHNTGQNDNRFSIQYILQNRDRWLDC